MGSCKLAKKQFLQTVFEVTPAQGLHLGHRYMQKMMDARKHAQQDANLYKAWGQWVGALMYLGQSLTSEVL